MSDSKAIPEVLTIGGYRQAAELTIEQLAEKLERSIGHTSDLCTGKQRVSRKIAHRMEAISGIPWHRWMSEAAP